MSEKSTIIEYIGFHQLDAVPNAAPLVLIERLLISVGYNHGTP